MKTHLQPTLENDLVLLRPVEVSDFNTLYAAANDPLIWELHQNPDRHEKAVFREFFKDAQDSKGAFAVIDKATNTVIGSSRFKLHNKSTDAVEIGWTFLSRAYWGGVYNQSFKTLMVDFAFQHFKYILFNVDQNNYRSQKAVLKLGGQLIDKQGPLKHLHTEKESGLTFVLKRSS